MTTAQVVGRLMIAFLILAIAVAVWVVALDMARGRPLIVRVQTRIAGALELAIATWLAVAVWMAPA